MAALNALFSDQDLAAMTQDQRQFLIDRIEHYFGSPEVMDIVSKKLQETVKAMPFKGQSPKVLSAAEIKTTYR